MSRPTFALLLVITLSMDLVACGSSVATSPSSDPASAPAASSGNAGHPDPSSSAGLTEAQIADAIRFRSSIIASHYGLGDALTVESDDTGVQLLARGTVRGQVRDGADRPVEGLDVTGTSTQQPGLCGDGEMGVSTDANGRFEIGCTVGVHVIEVRRQQVGSSVLVGQSNPVRVVKDGVAVVEIRTQP
jgi:hypothetical protein